MIGRMDVYPGLAFKSSLQPTEETMRRCSCTYSAHAAKALYNNTNRIRDQ